MREVFSFSRREAASLLNLDLCTTPFVPLPIRCGEGHFTPRLLRPCLSAARAEGPSCDNLGWSEQRERRPRSPVPGIPLRPEGPERIGILPCAAHTGRRGLFGEFTWGFALGASPQAVTGWAFSPGHRPRTLAGARAGVGIKTQSGCRPTPHSRAVSPSKAFSRLTSRRSRDR